MAKSKKSKILAMALCASVMTGIYASPVMAAELYEYNNDSQWVTTKGDNGTKITELEGLEEITLDDSVKIIAGGEGIIRVGDAGGVNTRVHNDGFYVNTYGDDRNELTETSLKAGTLTLAGNKLTSTQLVNIKRVVARVDSSGSANFTALTVDGSITSGGALTVKNENGTASLSSTALNIGKAVTVRNDGIARFGALDGANVRVENGVLTVNSTGETDVAKLDAQGLTLTSGATEATLSAEQIARLNTVVTQNGESIVVTADHFKNTNNSFAVGSNGAVRAADGKFNVGADGDVAIQYAKDGAIVANENGFAVQKGSAQTVVTNFGVANIYDDNRVEVNANGVGLAAGLKADGSAAAQISVTDDGIGLQGGTSEVVLNSNNGAVFTNGEGNGETVINGGSITTNRITTGTVNGVAIGMNADGDITLGNNVVIDGDFNSDNIAGITRVERNDSEPGSEVTYIEKNTAVSADGIVVKDPVSGVSTKTKYDGFYVKDKTGNNVSSLKDDGLMLTDQESGKQTLNATDIADIKGIDRSGNDTDGYKTTIEGATSFTKDGMVTSNITTDNITTGSFTAGVTEDSIYHINANGEMLFRSGGNYIGMNRDGIGFTSGTESVTINDNGTTFTSGDSTTRTTTSTVIKGGTITTGSTTITSDSITTKTLNVDKIVLGDKIVDKNTGDVIGAGLEIGADGSIKIDDTGTDAVEFNATKTALSANYGKTSLNMDSDGFNLNYGTGENAASLVLNGSGFAFDGPVNLGLARDVKFDYSGDIGSYTGNSYSLDQLLSTVDDIYNRTEHISVDDNGNTTISSPDGNNSITVGDDRITMNGDTEMNGDNTIGGEGGSGDGSVTNPNSDHIVNGGQTVNNGQTVNGDAQFNDKVTVGKQGGENGQTVIDGGTITTGATTIKGSGMTVGIGENATSITNDTVKAQNGDFDNLTAGSGTFGTGDNQTTINNDGVTVGGENGTSITGEGITVGDKNGVSIKNDEVRVGGGEDGKGGSYMNDTDVVSGEGVSLNQTAERVGHLENRVGKLEDRIDKVGAMAAAIANLRTMGYDPAAPTEVAVGIGQYRDETGAALGLFHYPNRDFMLSLSVSTSGDEVMGGIGATWKFGRKSPEKVAEIKKAQAEADARRAEEAKLAKAEEMKQAAKEAKIKAQQERHAKLAAQAEAAK